MRRSEAVRPDLRGGGRAAHGLEHAVAQLGGQLHHVVTDVVGVTGLKVIRAIVAGERDPQVLAKYRDARCKASPETIAAAVNIGRTQTALGAFYRRLAVRAGKAKAITATARKLAVLFYNALRHGLAYKDPGVSYYEERYRQRALHNLERRAKQLGYALVTAEATSNGVS